MNTSIKPIVLIIIDGWGVAPAGPNNLFDSAKVNFLKSLISHFPSVSLKASGPAVGLPANQPGKCGAGYLTIGMGRPIPYNKQEKYTLVDLPDGLCQVISENNLKQLVISETERYNQATYYFCGKKEKPFDNQKWLLMPSLPIGNYSLKPAMSADKITKTALKALNENSYNFIMISYANLDVLAGLNDRLAVKKAFKVIDKNIKKIVKLVLSLDGSILITADHGAIESLPSVQARAKQTHRTANPVPFIYANQKWQGKTFEREKETMAADLSIQRPVGTLADAAPTILKLINLEKPKKMTGQSLI